MTVSMNSLDVYICEYENSGVDGTEPICKVHGSNSQFEPEIGAHRPCLSVYPHGMVRNEWLPGSWWRVMSPQGAIWAETSNEQEARDSMRPGDTLYRGYTQSGFWWVQQDA